MNTSGQAMAQPTPEQNPVQWRAHDLLWISGRQALLAHEPFPPWALDSIQAQMPVVVRRATLAAGRIAVGLRGLARSERFAAHVAADAVLRGCSPETLALQAAWNNSPQQAMPALQALAAMAPQLDTLALPWGPTGSAGFALATGLPVLRPQSDLDLLIRSAVPLSPQQVQALLAAAAGQACRIDIQIDTGHGGFALTEWAAKRGSVLLKTDDGPVLASNPWDPPAVVHAA